MTDRREGANSHDRSERRIDDIVALLRKLTVQLMQTTSVSDLFDSGFRVLCDVLPVDIAVAVTLEQNLSLYISTRPDLRPLVNDALMDRIRQALEKRLSIAFAPTDVLVRSETSGLPSDGPVAAVPYDLNTIFEVESRTAGLLAVFRASKPFSDDEANLLAIFSAHLALHLGSLRARERIMQLADTDELTGIANKRHFRRRLAYEMDRARVYNLPLTLLLLDIDDFKLVNDTHGHTMGDVVLSEFCGTILDSLRPPDFFARFGGDEFALILPHTDMAGAQSVADRVMAQVRDLALFATDDQTQVSCSVSIGIAEFQPADMQPEDLVRRADLKLYDSKRLGKNRYTA